MGFAAKRRRKDATRAVELAAEGASYLHADRARAATCYREAIRLDPDLHAAWFDLGLVHKWAGDWEQAFACNLRAAELVGEAADEPAWWNLGIAATALHRWDVARRAWTAYGVSVPVGSGPIEGDYGNGVVRLNPEGATEVVWGRRIDPARMRLTSIPLPESGHRWADVVLHDGAPHGYREVDGRRYPVFDELVRWSPSDVPTVQAIVTASSVADLDRLLAQVEQAGYAAEDWSREIQLLCRECSEGAVSHDHAGPAFDAGREHRIGIAAPLPVAGAVVAGWVEAGGGSCRSIDEAV